MDVEEGKAKYLQAFGSFQIEAKEEPQIDDAAAEINYSNDLSI